MGNCQAVDNAALLVQHPSGRVDKLYSPLPAAHLLKSNPGHHVALLLTTTVYSSSSSAGTAAPLRVTRIKLLRPTDTLHLGHVYRLLTSQEVMKGVLARKQAKKKKMEQLRKKQEKSGGEKDDEVISNSNSNTAIKEGQRSRRNNSNSTPLKSRTWQPALKSISESAT